MVLPPANPTYNDGVERETKTFREAFYNQSNLQADSVGGIQNELSNAVDKYNTYRLYFSLQGQTPMEYITHLKQEAT